MLQVFYQIRTPFHSGDKLGLIQCKGKDVGRPPKQEVINDYALFKVNLNVVPLPSFEVTVIV